MEGKQERRLKGSKESKKNNTRTRTHKQANQQQLTITWNMPWPHQALHWALTVRASQHQGLCMRVCGCALQAWHRPRTSLSLWCHKQLKQRVHMCTGVITVWLEQRAPQTCKRPHKARWHCNGQAQDMRSELPATAKAAPKVSLHCRAICTLIATCLCAMMQAKREGILRVKDLLQK